MNIDTLSENIIKQFEYCFLVEDTYHNDSQFKVNIPKVMPLINLNEPKEAITNIGNNIFINDNNYKINNSNQIKTQNYLTIPRFKNTDFRDKSYEGTLKKGDKFICCFMNENIRDVHLTDNI